LTGLRPFTTYTVVYEVCTAVGCSRSRSASFQTTAAGGLHAPEALVTFLFFLVCSHCSDFLPFGF
jgi:hypothetical protein